LSRLGNCFWLWRGKKEYGIRQNGRLILVLFSLVGCSNRGIGGSLIERADAKEREANVNDPAAEREEMEFSLVTGEYRTRKTFANGNGNGNSPAGEDPVDGMGALTVRNKEFSLAKLESAGSKLSQQFSGPSIRMG